MEERSIQQNHIVPYQEIIDFFGSNLNSDQFEMIFKIVAEAREQEASSIPIKAELQEKFVQMVVEVLKELRDGESVK